MFGIGVMAACIVLFVPMGMAGWHLSRNKMLFFSGALFISLAVFVHLTPFFPSSISNFFSISSNKLPLLVFDNRESCISFLHHIVFHVKPPPPPPLSDTPLPLINTTNSNHYHPEVEISWDWSANSTPVLACDFQKLGDSDASDLLNGSWIVVAGDSQARFIALSLLNLVLNSQDMGSVKADLFKRHTNYQIVISDIGMKFDFIWAPFVTNLTQLIMDFKQNRSYPDVLVMGSGLWHMLHITNESDYGASLQLMRNSMVSLVPASPEFGTDGPLSGSVSVQSPHLFWLGMPMLVNSMLNTVEKREKMSNAAYNAYDRELYKSKVLRQSGGPLLLLDMQSLSRSCGAHCTVDGIHYDEAVYEAAVHIMLNALLIESHQKL